MVDEKCARCGNVPDGKNHLTYCSYKHVFVCLMCERTCKNYSAETLRNGTHCKKKFFEEEYKYRLLSSKILAPEYDVQGAICKYEKINSVELYKKFRTQVAHYKIIDTDDVQRWARARVELAAIQHVLRERELSNPKLSAWARKFFISQ